MDKPDLIYKIRKYIKEFSKKDFIMCFCALVLVVIILIRFYSDKKSVPAFSETTKIPSETSQMHTEIEIRLQNTLSEMNGVGKVSVLVTYSDNVSIPIGAVIIAEGASLPETRVAIEQAVRTALGIEARQIKIYEMGNK